MPMADFRRACRAYAERFIGVMTEEFKRLGVFGDWDHPYVTMDFRYQAAIARAALLARDLEVIFDRCDAIVTPSAPGTAPAGLESTGDPAFCTLWTLCGMPAVNLPLMRGENGLPLGVQLVGQRHRDARLLRTARWLTAHVRGESQSVTG